MSEPRRTALHPRHRALGAKMVTFAGWEMPLAYPGGIFREHAAVRSAGGLFDVSHMGVLEFRGARAGAFLDAVLTGAASRLTPGRAMYTCLLAPDGVALDDLYVYRAAERRFLLVVNAANAARDVEHFEAVLRGEIEALPGLGPVPRAEFRDLREAGDDSLVLLACPGRAALEVLVSLAGTAAQAGALRASRLNDVFPAQIADVPVWAAHTGYTGEEVGFELFVHPARAGELWERLLECGREHGLAPCGLGARDSLRIEAGLPLFGQDLEGPQALTAQEAGYGFVVRMKKPFFVGREAYAARISPPRKRLLRLKGQGRRSVRPGHAILDGADRPIGAVTSFAFTDEQFNFHVLAAVRSDFEPADGQTIRAARIGAEQWPGPPAPGQIVELALLPRFPTPAERAGWKDRYARAV